MKSKETQKLIRALRHRAIDPSCLVCDYEDHCSIHGCQIINKAADLLNELQPRNAGLEQGVRSEHQAYFRLGQIDMRESIASMLRKKADSTFGMTAAALQIAADMVDGVEVLK